MTTAVVPTTPVKAFRQEMTRYVPRMAEVVAARGAEEYARRQVGLAALAAMKNPELMKCDPNSVAQAMIRVCGWRLEIGTTAHLVPFGRECTAIPDWKGLIELVLRSGHVRDMFAHPVHQRDHFRVTLGTEPRLEHEPAGGDRGDVIGYYAVAVLRQGRTTFEYMTEEQVERIRAAARSGNSPAWKQHRAEMGRKTVIRRLCKRLPQSDALRAALGIDEEIPAGALEALPDTVIPTGAAAALTDGRGNDGNRLTMQLPAGDPYAAPADEMVHAEDVAPGEHLREVAGHLSPRVTATEPADAR